MLNKSANKYFQNIRASNKTLIVNCNAGAKMLEEKGDGRNLSIWVMEHGIANIISIGLLQKEGYKISYETGGMWIITTSAR